MKKVAILSRKGGVGKSTTASALAYGLARKGKSVLLIDLDSQRNLTYSVFGDEAPEETMLDVFRKTKGIGEVIYTIGEKIDMAAGNAELGNMDLTYAGKPEGPYILGKALEKIDDSYDYCIIDTPPALGLLTVNAMQAADECVVPVRADVFSQQGTYDLGEALDATRTYFQNPDLKVSGLLITQLKKRALLTKFMIEDMEEYAKQLDTKIYTAKIRDCIKIPEAQAANKNIYEYAGSSNAAEDYAEFVDEFLNDEKKAERKAKKGAETKKDTKAKTDKNTVKKNSKSKKGE